MKSLKELLGGMSGGRILDVATGDAAFIRLLAENLRDYDEITGIDIEEELVCKTAGQNTDGRITFRCMSGENIDYPDGHFDTVSLSNSLHHLGDIDKTIRELLRVLKPGGVLIVNELFSDGLNEKQLTHLKLHHFQSDIDTLAGITHGKTLSKAQIFEILHRNGITHYESAVHENEFFNRNINPERFAAHYRNALEKIRDRPEYPQMKAVLEQLTEKLNTVGVEFTSQLLIVAKKA